MIPIRFVYDKTEKDRIKVTEEYVKLNLYRRSLFAREKLDEWCKNHLPQEHGREYTFKRVVMASPKDLMELKNFMDQHIIEFQQYNKELRLN